MANNYGSSVLLLLLVFVFSSQHADSSSNIVKFLPGFQGPLPFELETGYIGIGEEEAVQLFYYFIKSESNPEEDPPLLWLSGGPGCSSISGLLYENGPFTVKLEVYNGTRPSLVPTTYSWTKVSNIIYLDQPVGTGFFYSRTQLHNKPSDSGEAKRISEFLHKWLDKHQEFSSARYMWAEILIAVWLYRTSFMKSQQGYILGDPATEKESDFDHRIPYAHGMALISDELYESLKRICKGKYINVDLGNTECLKLLKEYEKCINRINLPLIHTPKCEETSPDCYSYRYLLTTYWANDESVRRVLKANKNNIGEWVRCNWGMPYTFDIKSSVPYHLNNSINGYYSLIFRSDF